MKKAILKDESSLISRLTGPEHPADLPIKGEPGIAHVTHTHTGAGSPPSSSQTPAPAQSCTCGLELGCIPPYQIGDEEFDMVIFTKRCEIHEQGKHGDFLEGLEDFNQPRLRLTMEGLKMQMRLYRERNSEVEVKTQTPGGVK